MTTLKPVQTFITVSGVRVPALTTEQMREVDRIALEETGPNLYQMMENAGRNLASLTMELSGDSWQAATIVVLAGTGGNGGGGICAARHLANRRADVRLCFTNPQHLSDVAAFQRKIFQATGGKEISLQNLSGIKPTIIIDAIIGYSLKAAPRGKALEMIRWANKSTGPVLSLDVPSGLDATTGNTPGEFIRPDWTITLALPKTVLLPERTGKLFLADIGIPTKVYRKLELDYVPPFGNQFITEIFPAGS